MQHDRLQHTLASMRCDYILLCQELDIEPENELITGWPKGPIMEETVNELSRVIDNAENDLNFLRLKQRKA